jgi:hypothetical protein
MAVKKFDLKVRMDLSEGVVKPVLLDQGSQVVLATDYDTLAQLVKMLVEELKDGGTYIGPKHSSIADPAPSIMGLVEALEKILK